MAIYTSICICIYVHIYIYIPTRATTAPITEVTPTPPTAIQMILTRILQQASGLGLGGAATAGELAADALLAWC